MKSPIIERRANTRYDLRMPLRYRVSQKGDMPYVGSGLTQDLSTQGIGFRCRKSLPVGAHVELLVDWPTKYGDRYPIELQVTGFVLRSDNGRTAVRMTSHRLRVLEDPVQAVRVSA
jgi:PilZ domain